MDAPAILLKGGTLVTMDRARPDEFVGDLLIRDDLIAEIGTSIEPPPGANVIDVTGSIVIPGLVDTHRHSWQALLRFAGVDWTIPQYGPAMFGNYGPRFTANDMYLSLRVALAEAVDSGITQLLDWNHNLTNPAHVEATVRAHLDSGMRVVFGYGESPTAWLGTYSAAHHGEPDDYLQRVRAFREHGFPDAGGRLTLAMAVRGPEKSPLEVVEAQWRTARDLGIRLSVHVGNGPNGRQRAVAGLSDAGLLGDDTTYIHCSTIADDEIAMIADSGGTASVAPVVEANMGHGPLALGRLIAAGVPASLSVDTCANAGGDLFGAMRAAVMITRSQDHQEHLERGEWAAGVSLPVKDALALATIGGARANGLTESTGSLTVGKQADVVVLSTRQPNMFPTNSAIGAVVAGAHPGNVDSVFVGGRALKRNGRLLDDPEQLRVQASAAAARLMSGELPNGAKS